QMPGIVVTQHTLDVRSGEHLPDDIEHSIIVKGVTDLLELFEEALQHTAFNGVGSHKIENQAILPLPVTIDAAHALFETVRVPRDLVVAEDVATLQVNPLAGGLSGDQDLDGTVFELLLGMQTRARLIARARLHAAVNTTNAETPLLQALHEVVERILEL